MYEDCRILIVDDEEHVVESLMWNLQQIPRMNAEVYGAGGAEEALSLCRKAKFDLLMTDIEMPNTNGIDLLAGVKELWPRCKTLVLTAHSKFDYAYQAFSHHADDFILKIEKDEVILKRVVGLLDQIEAERAISRQLQSFSQQLSLNTESKILPLLCSPQSTTPVKTLLLQEPGLKNQSGFYFVLLRSASELDRETTLKLTSLISQNAPAQLSLSGWAQSGANELILLFQAASVGRPDKNQLTGSFELLQQTILPTLQLHVSFFAYSTPVEAAQFHDAYRLFPAEHSENDLVYVTPFTRKEPDISSVEYLTNSIIRYINRHIAEDISLLQLSEITGYSSSYISRTFQKLCGSTLSEYISQRKLEFIHTLMQNPQLSINDIVDQSGFHSHSYFYRFIRKMTGLAPKVYQMQCLQETKMEEQKDGIL